MGKIFRTDRRIRLGIWGLCRGSSFIDQCKQLNVDVVAGCDINPMMCDRFRGVCPDAFVTQDENEFLARDIDAVLIATWFGAHAEHSIKALNAGKHVICEVTSFFTPAEGVKLVEAVEKSGKLYFLAENYPATKFNLFIKKLWQEGIFGELSYAEYNYVHDCRPLCYSYGTSTPVVPGNTAHNWRSWLNFHYYCTHSLGPVMQITGTRPVQVFAPPLDKNLPGFLPGSQMGSMAPSLIVMDNGGVVRNLVGAGTADSQERCIWGTKAYVTMNNDWEPVVVVGQSGHGHWLNLKSQWPEFGEYADKCGHGGGDFWTIYYFANAVLNGAEVPWDIYRACDATLAGIMAVRSQQQGGKGMEVPDFRKPEVRERFRNDNGAQEHFDPAKIFPDDQDTSLTMEFTSIMNNFDVFRGEARGTVLVNAAFEGMKLYAYLADDRSRMQVVHDVQNLLKALPALNENYRKARALMERYPDSPAGCALRSFLESGRPEKIFDMEGTAKELTDWLLNNHQEGK